MLKKLARKEEGFTLIELLVVVAIIALLTAFAVPRLFEAINSSKGAQGNSDMQTITGALERHYMDKNAYPKTDETTVMTALKGDYLKAATTFANGFGRGYIYLTDSNGGFYVMVDPRNLPNGTTPASVVVKCGSATADAINVGTAFDVVVTSKLTPADVKAGPCSVTTTTTGYLAPVLITN